MVFWERRFFIKLIENEKLIYVGRGVSLISHPIFLPVTFKEVQNALKLICDVMGVTSLLLSAVMRLQLWSDSMG